MKFSKKDFFSKCNPIRRKLRIWSHLLKKSLIENFIFCAVTTQKIKFPVKNFVIKCKQIRGLLQIYSHLLKKSLAKIFISCAVLTKDILAKLRIINAQKNFQLGKDCFWLLFNIIITFFQIKYLKDDNYHTILFFALGKINMIFNLSMI